MEELELVSGSPFLFTPQTEVVHRIELDEAELAVAKMMGNTEEDLKKYGCKEPFAESEAQSEGIEAAVLRIAKQLGNTEADLKRYGY